MPKENEDVAGTEDTKEEPKNAQSTENSDEGNSPDNEGEGSGEGNSIDKFPPEAVKIIKELRNESAKYRNQRKTLSEELEGLKGGIKRFVGGEEDEEVDPTEALAAYEQQSESLAIQNQILAVAVENSIPNEDFEYFQFLMSKGIDSLEEGEEFTEDMLSEVVNQIKSRKAKGTTSVGSGTPSPSKGEGEISLAEFNKMGTIAKSKLYRERPELYEKLSNEAKAS